MKKVDYLLLSISYVLAFIVSIMSETHAVTNPGLSDYIAGGLGGLVGAFLIASIFTLPINFAGGLSKEEYLRNTFVGMPIVLIVALIFQVL